MAMKLVWNKSDYSIELQGLTVVAAPRGYPPFNCQASVEEQDTQLVLGEQTVLKDPGKPGWYLAHTLQRDSSHRLGAVVVSGRAPLRLLAVVHDLDREPTCTRESIWRAYVEIFNLVACHQITSLATPLLGTVHGKLAQTESLDILRDTLLQQEALPLQRLWLMVPDGKDHDHQQLLAQLQRHSLG